MNDIQVFDHPVFSPVRVLDIDGTPWFVGKDVALALGYSNTKDALAKHVDPEDKTDGVAIRDPIGREQHPTIINESGLYSLIFSSKLPTAKLFKRWVTAEVLPAIRKTGAYAVSGATRPLSSDDYINAAAIIAKCALSRLPAVVGLLIRAGIQVDAQFIQDAQANKYRKPRRPDIDVADQLTACDLIRDATQKLGISYKQIIEITGITQCNLWMYAHGQRRPKPNRARKIIAAVAPLLTPDPASPAAEEG